MQETEFKYYSGSSRSCLSPSIKLVSHVDLIKLVSHVTWPSCNRSRKDITGTSEDGNIKELLWDNFKFNFLASFLQHTQSNKRLELINIVPNPGAREGSARSVTDHPACGHGS